MSVYGVDFESNEKVLLSSDSWTFTPNDTYVSSVNKSVCKSFQNCASYIIDINGNFTQGSAYENIGSINGICPQTTIYGVVLEGSGVNVSPKGFCFIDSNGVIGFKAEIDCTRAVIILNFVA